ncbi:MAG: hypothetical protein WC866_04150 [Patescibacteria group bacterium]|jgi:hypothetical protein
MPREICQVPKLLAAGVSSLCDTCSVSGSCTELYALRLIKAGDPRSVIKTAIVAECSSHVPFGGSFSSKRGHLGPELFQTKVRDLCEGCPDEERGACDHRRKLDGLIQIGINRGGWIKPVMVGCTTKSRRRKQALFQISEPHRNDTP